jgi:hypothetical protein
MQGDCIFVCVGVQGFFGREGSLNRPWCVTANREIVVVSDCSPDHGLARLAVFDAKTTHHLRYLGISARGPEPMQLRNPWGVRLLRDGRHVVVTETCVGRDGSFNVLAFDAYNEASPALCVGNAATTPGAALAHPVDVLEGEGFLVVANFFGNNLSFITYPPPLVASGEGSASAYDLEPTGCSGAVPLSGTHTTPEELLLRYPAALAFVPGLGILVREAGQGKPGRSSIAILISK